VLPLQQPFGHDVASQTQCPLPLHSCPEAHDAHTAPVDPHDELLSLVSCSQVWFAVQQPGHDAPPQEQAPDAQLSPFPHAAHAAPPVPHAVADCAASGTHVLPAQHPPGHELASQTHCPVRGSHS
jgi:hypothetical protein